MRYLMIPLLFVLSIMSAGADEKEDSVISFMGLKVNRHDTSWDDYNPERGFFQKAYSDKSDPRFMIANEDETFEFGIGGVLRMTAFEDFGGATNHKGFSTWHISVPTDYAHNVGINVMSSRVFFKSKVKFGRKRLISYIELSANDQEQIGLNQAYFSYGGFSVGKTHSFFEDLAAGVQTVDLKGPNTSISKCHALIGYTFDFGRHFILGMAAEQPDYATTEYQNLGIYSEYQNLPDFAARFVWKGDFGHLQASGLVRSLSYWTFNRPMSQVTVSNSDGTSKHVLGWGVSLSGRFNLTPQCFLTFQSIYGKGIQQYINDFSNVGMDLVPTRVNKDTDEQYYKMRALPAWGGYLGFQYNWNRKLTTSAVLGMVGMDNHKVQTFSWEKSSYSDYVNDCNLYDYRYASYLALSTFYHLNDYCTVGAEYLNGMRCQRERDYDTMTLTGESNHGVANRFNLMFSYSF